MYIDKFPGFCSSRASACVYIYMSIYTYDVYRYVRKYYIYYIFLLQQQRKRLRIYMSCISIYVCMYICVYIRLRMLALLWRSVRLLQVFKNDFKLSLLHCIHSSSQPQRPRHNFPAPPTQSVTTLPIHPPFPPRPPPSQHTPSPNRPNRLKI